MTSIERILLAIFGFIVLFVTQVKGANPALERELAAKLISEASQIRAEEVTIGPMQEAEYRVDKTTTVQGGICVTFIAPVIANGGRRRTIQTRVFYYDIDWGWYLYAVEEARGGDAIGVVSEHKGRMQLR